MQTPGWIDRENRRNLEIRRIVMKNSKKTRYVLLPSDGVVVPEGDAHQTTLFQALHRSAGTFGKLHSLPTRAGPIPITVVDSIGPGKAKLLEMAVEDLPNFRSVHPSVRLMPLVYFRRAVVLHRVRSAPGGAGSHPAPAQAPVAARGRGARAQADATANGAGGAITLTVVSARDGSPVGGASVVAFTDFAAGAGAQGTTDARGQVALALGAASVTIDRVFVYPIAGYWPAMQAGLLLSEGSTIALLPIDLGYVDCVRYFYPGTGPASGAGVTVGVIDSGVATNHPDLTLQGGRNTVPGESPQDFGDNGTEGHGTHVAGIIAARGTPPAGIRGVAPGVALRSYRVFGQGEEGASNYAIAKAIDAAVTDGCDLVNMSLGGGDPDPVTAEALTAAHGAGVVILAANGNDNRQPVSFPAANNMCQAVSAFGREGTFPDGTEAVSSVAAPFGTDARNFLASFSNIGPETDLTGPGVGVISTVPTGYGVMSGTSMATPAETGAAARLLAGRTEILAMPRDADRSAAMIDAIAQACQPLGFGATFEGKGVISFPRGR